MSTLDLVYIFRMCVYPLVYKRALDCHKKGKGALYIVGVLKSYKRALNSYKRALDCHKKGKGALYIVRALISYKRALNSYKRALDCCLGKRQSTT